MQVSKIEQLLTHRIPIYRQFAKDILEFKSILTNLKFENNLISFTFKEKDYTGTPAHLNLKQDHILTYNLGRSTEKLELFSKGYGELFLLFENLEIVPFWYQLKNSTLPKINTSAYLISNEIRGLLNE